MKIFARYYAVKTVLIFQRTDCTKRETKSFYSNSVACPFVDSYNHPHTVK